MKKFLIIGNMNAISYKEIFPLIKENKIWFGTNFNKTMMFELPNEYEKFDHIENGKKVGKVPAIAWFTNLEHKKRHLPLDLYKKYNADEYPTYDNYNAIEVSKVADIPMDEEIIIDIDPSEFESWKKTYGDDVEIIE